MRPSPFSRGIKKEKGKLGEQYYYWFDDLMVKERDHDSHSLRSFGNVLGCGGGTGD